MNTTSSVLATKRFVHSTLNNRGESRTYRRERWLSERVLTNHNTVFFCSSCYNPLALGEHYAAGSYGLYCKNCYRPMSEAEAAASVTIDDMRCVRVDLREYFGVSIHDFEDCAVIVSETGWLYRFRNLEEAQASLDQATLLLEHASQVREGQPA